MTVNVSTSRAQYNGNGSTTAFTVPFRFLDNSHLLVVKTSSAGVDTTLVLNTDYTVTGAGASTGTVTATVAPATGEKITIVRNMPFSQQIDLVNNDPLPAETLEAGLDARTMEAQQLSENIDRALTLPVTATSVSTELPSPEANNIIGWDASATALANVPISSLATAIAATTWTVQTFDGTGAQTAFTLSGNPGNTYALMCAVNGVVQTPGVNFTVSGTTLTFLTGAPPSGTSNVVVQYGQSLPASGTVDLALASGTLDVPHGGTGATTLTGLVKGNGTGAFTAATAGTDYAAPGTAATFTTSQRGTQTTDNDLSFDLNVTNNFKATPTGGGTLTFTNIASATGQSGHIVLVNGSNYSIAAAATTKVGSSLLATISATGTYLLAYYCDGTNVYLTASGALA